jgi:hypothetical protein
MHPEKAQKVETPQDLHDAQLPTIPIAVDNPDEGGLAGVIAILIKAAVIDRVNALIGPPSLPDAEARQRTEAWDQDTLPLRELHLLVRVYQVIVRCDHAPVMQLPAVDFIQTQQLTALHNHAPNGYSAEVGEQNQTRLLRDATCERQTAGVHALNYPEVTASFPRG